MPAPLQISFVNFCNKTKQNFCQYIPYIMEYQIITQSTSDNPFKSVKLSIIRLIQKAVLTIPSCHHDCLFKATNITKFFLHTAHTHLLSIPIGCHVPLTNFSACSLVLQFSNSLYIHRDYLLFHIFAFINLTCFSMMKNHPVYWFNTARFCCK